MLVIQLDLLGFAVSTGAACTTGSSRPSHVLTAMGCSAEEAHDSLRISLGPGNSREEIGEFLAALESAVARLKGGEPIRSGIGVAAGAS
jgi:cysteine desulfurase